MNLHALSTECCSVCGAASFQSELRHGLCKTCESELRSAPGPFAGITARAEISWSALFEYAGIVIDVVAAIKQRYDHRPIALLREIALCRVSISSEDLVPVPCSRRGRRDRGFDQVRLFCDGLQGQCWPVLKRERGVQQKKLTRANRYTQAARQMNAKPKPLRHDMLLPERIVVVDDVLTTGASLERACEIICMLCSQQHNARTPSITGLMWCVDR